MQRSVFFECYASFCPEIKYIDSFNGIVMNYTVRGVIGTEKDLVGKVEDTTIFYPF